MFGSQIEVCLCTVILCECDDIIKQSCALYVSHIVMYYVLVFSYILMGWNCTAITTFIGGMKLIL